MFERFTKRARQVLVLAQDQARELHHNFIGTEHILLGLISEGEGIGGKVLTSFGLSLPALQAKVAATIGPGPAGPVEVYKPPFTPRAKKVLEYSLREALALGHNYIGTEHILLGLIREGEGVAAHVLVESGVELTEARTRVIDALRGYGAGVVAAPTPRLSQATTEAMGEATRLAEGQPVTTGQLLAGILSVEASQAAQALVALGVTKLAVDAKLAAIPLDTTSDAGTRPQAVEIKLGEASTVIADPDLASALRRASAEELERALRQLVRRLQPEPPPNTEPA
jgi:ATP-dependent Clp protease ATP-binding subunit ClpA